MSTEPQKGNGDFLRVDGVVVKFGGVTALDGVSFEIRRKQIMGLIGPNGAGKTTLFNCLSRLYTPDQGEIYFEGQPLSSRRPHEITALGIGRTFQNLALFGGMTVLQNVMTGGHARTHGGFWANAFWSSLAAREERDLHERAEALLEELDLQAVRDTFVLSLPFGVLKRVELARALISDPVLLLLDEPAGGLSHEELDSLGRLIQSLRDRRGLSILLVEHHMNFVMNYSDHVVAMDFGEVIAEDAPHAIQKHPEVIRAYLGEGAE